MWIRQVGQVNVEANRQFVCKLPNVRRFSGPDLGYVSIKADLRNLPQNTAKYLSVCDFLEFKWDSFKSILQKLFIPVKFNFQILLLNHNHEFSKGDQ